MTYRRYKYTPLPEISVEEKLFDILLETIRDAFAKGTPVSEVMPWIERAERLADQVDSKRKPQQVPPHHYGGITAAPG